MRPLFRIFIVIVCGFFVLALVLPLIFGDKRPQAFRAAFYGDTNYLKSYLAKGSNVNALLISYYAGMLFSSLTMLDIGGRHCF